MKTVRKGEMENKQKNVNDNSYRGSKTKRSMAVASLCTHLFKIGQNVTENAVLCDFNWRRLSQHQN